MTLRSQDFKSCVYTSSTTRPQLTPIFLLYIYLEKVEGCTCFLKCCSKKNKCAPPSPQSLRILFRFLNGACARQPSNKTQIPPNSHVDDGHRQPIFCKKLRRSPSSGIKTILNSLAGRSCYAPNKSSNDGMYDNHDWQQPKQAKNYSSNGISFFRHRSPLIFFGGVDRNRTGE